MEYILLGLILAAIIGFPIWIYSVKAKVKKEEAQAKMKSLKEYQAKVAAKANIGQVPSKPAPPPGRILGQSSFNRRNPEPASKSYVDTNAPSTRSDSGSDFLTGAITGYALNSLLHSSSDNSTPEWKTVASFDSDRFTDSSSIDTSSSSSSFSSGSSDSSWSSSSSDSSWSSSGL